MNELIGAAVLISIVLWVALVIAMRFMKKSLEVGILGLISLVTPWEFFFSKDSQYVGIHWLLFGFGYHFDNGNYYFSTLIDWYHWSLWYSISNAIAFMLVLVGSILLITGHSSKESSSFILLGALTPIIYDGLILIYYGFALHMTGYVLPLAFAVIEFMLVLVGSILLITGHSSLSYIALAFFATRVAEEYFTLGGYHIGVPVGLLLALTAGLTLLPPGRIEATKVKEKSLDEELLKATEKGNVEEVRKLLEKIVKVEKREVGTEVISTNVEELKEELKKYESYLSKLEKSKEEGAISENAYEKLKKEYQENIEKIKKEIEKSKSNV